MDKIVHKMTFRQNHVVGRHFTDVSLTVPDQSYSIRDLMQRNACGMEVPIERQVFYDEEQDVDKLLEHTGVDLSTLDLVELQEYKEMVNNRINELRSQNSTPPAPDSSNTEE